LKDASYAHSGVRRWRAPAVGTMLWHRRFSRKERAMAATQPPRQDPVQPAAHELADGLVPPMPDEDGPHDVPDDKVIEKTLPETHKQERGARPS
jgi:hypothetical protein